MKKVLLCVIAFTFLSCISDDETIPIVDKSAISFNLNGTDYSLTEYSVQLNPLDTNDRIIEASFDNNTKTLIFFVMVEETNQIDEFILLENGVEYSSDPTYGDRETSITIHTDSKMEGTFRVNIKDARDQPIFTFTNGVIDIEY
ncbi:hypothetical protein [Kordia sp.]|uniref:hypothetical protein n=1 Tax=Kordia sp. TaxID=1965332 RepID=UPI003B5B3B03